MHGTDNKLCTHLIRIPEEKRALRICHLYGRKILRHLKEIGCEGIDWIHLALVNSNKPSGSIK
jgi:hypothetical protein